MTQLTALLLSLLIEVPLVMVLFWWIRRPLKTTEAFRCLLISVAATLVTHPIAWWLMKTLSIPSLVKFLGIEAGVFLLEGIIYFYFTPLSLKRSMFMSFVANAASAGIGYILTHY